jgi:RimJ/RimL family protein N-acetyltransferase
MTSADLGGERSGSTVLTTERLTLRELAAADAPFILELVNEPSWLRFIGDKGVRTLADAEKYIVDGPARMYTEHGFGLWLVELSADSLPIGICGLIRRESLPDVDVGFAFLPAHWHRGYASEAAAAVVAHGRSAFGLERILAITTGDNEASSRLLERLGFRFERWIALEPGGPELRLYAIGR